MTKVPCWEGHISVNREIEITPGYLYTGTKNLTVRNFNADRWRFLVRTDGPIGWSPRARIRRPWTCVRFIFQGILRTCSSTVLPLAILRPIRTHPLHWSRPIFLLVFLALWVFFFPFLERKTIFFSLFCLHSESENAVAAKSVEESALFILFYFWQIFKFLKIIVKSKTILLRRVVRSNTFVTSSRNCTMLSCLHFNRWRCCQVYRTCCRFHAEDLPLINSLMTYVPKLIRILRCSSNRWSFVKFEHQIYKSYCT